MMQEDENFQEWTQFPRARAAKKRLTRQGIDAIHQLMAEMHSYRRQATAGFLGSSLGLAVYNYFWQLYGATYVMLGWVLSLTVILFLYVILMGIMDRVDYLDRLVGSLHRHVNRMYPENDIYLKNVLSKLDTHANRIRDLEHALLAGLASDKAKTALRRTGEEDTDQEDEEAEEMQKLSRDVKRMVEATENSRKWLEQLRTHEDEKLNAFFEDVNQEQELKEQMDHEVNDLVHELAKLPVEQVDEDALRRALRDSKYADFMRFSEGCGVKIDEDFIVGLLRGAKEIVANREGGTKSEDDIASMVTEIARVSHSMAVEGRTSMEAKDESDADRMLPMVSLSSIP